MDHPKADLGVLLVHGIGQSDSGETLVRFGEPLVEWLVRWVGGAALADAEVVDATLGVEADDPETPAHTYVRVKAPPTKSADDAAAVRTPSDEAEPTVEKTWLIVESWWARSFATPSFADLANWGFRIVPWTLVFHFQRRLRAAATGLHRARAEARSLATQAARAGRLLLEIVALTLALFLSPILLAVIAIVLLIGLIPIPRVRGLVHRLQRGLALTVGDSYALLGPNIGAGAIYGRVTRDLEWLSERAETTAVVAHSQGAAVGYRVVSRQPTASTKQLVTFGAGIRKLAQIRLLEGAPRNWVWSIALAIILFVVVFQISRVTFGLGRAVLLTFATLGIWFGGLFLLGAVIGAVRRSAGGLPERATNVLSFVFLGVAIAGVTWLMPGTSRSATFWVSALTTFSVFLALGSWMQAREYISNFIELTPQPGTTPVPPGEAGLPEDTTWVDVYATKDPVPNGAIFDGVDIDAVALEGTAGGFTQVKVWNESSLTRDHSAYWGNREGFISRIAGLLGHLVGQEVEEVLSFDAERLVVARHRRRWRVGWLITARLTVVAGALAIWFGARDEGYEESLLNGLIDVFGRLPILGSWLADLLPQDIEANDVTSAAVLIVVAIILNAVVRLTWRWWEGGEIEELVTRGAYQFRSGTVPSRAYFNFVWLVTIAMSVILVLGWTTWAWWTYLIVGGVLWFMSGALAAVDPLAGLLGTTWPKLLNRYGRATDEALTEFTERMKSEGSVLIDAIAAPDGTPIWDAGHTLTYRGPQLTHWYQTERFADPSAALGWAAERASHVYVRTDPTQPYLTAEDWLAAQAPPDPTIVIDDVDAAIASGAESDEELAAE